MPNAQFRFTVLRPEADRGDKAKGGEENASIKVEMRFPIEPSTNQPYGRIAELSIAEIRLFLGSAHEAYIQLYNWCNTPSSRITEEGIEKELILEDIEKDWGEVTTFLKAYPNTIISWIDTSGE